MSELVPLEQVQDRAEKVRARLAPAPTEGLHKTPDQMIDDLEWAKYGTGQIALVLKQAAENVKATTRAYREARARVIQKSEAKSTDKREAEVDIECSDVWAAMQDALIVQAYAKDVARAIEQTGSMTQTQAGLVKAQMALAGTGREA